MVECLLASPTERCFLKISNEEGKLTEKSVKSAALLYKLLMKETIIDTRATTYQLRSSSKNLKNYMGTVKSNIELFNLHVKNAREGLNSRGESVNDLLVKPFKGCRTIAYTNFVEYIEKKEEIYLDGEDFYLEELM